MSIVPLEEKLRTVRIRLEEIPATAVYALPGDRAWLFLDYPGWANGRVRWAIVARREHEDFQLVKLLSASTHESGLDLIPREVELAKEAIARIRASAFDLGGARDE